MRAAIYLRVSTTDQSTSNQERELRSAADRMGHEVVEIYEDFGISGGKGRDKRPAFDRLHHDAARRKFDIVMAWSVDRLGRSLQDLVAFLEHIRACDIGLFLHQQGLDTTTPSGRAMFRDVGRFRRVRAQHYPRACEIRHGSRQGERYEVRQGDRAAPPRLRSDGTRSGTPTGLVEQACERLRSYTVSALRRCGAAWLNKLPVLDFCSRRV